MIFYLIGLLSYYRLANKPVPLGVCIVFFFVIAVPPVTALYLLLNSHWVFQVIAFVAGWFCWTFIEYFIHRFWLHRNKNDHHFNEWNQINHIHPEKIITNDILRILIAFLATILIYVSLDFSNFLILPAGIISGCAIYGYIHFLIHKRCRTKWFNKLRAFHLKHHHRANDKCFGVSVTWWDLLFNTGPKTGKPISLNIKKNFGKFKTKQSFNH
ncbi:MAG TPA: sterol desaturase family protein [Chitinophagaceae bacterium]|nr:sterol desaturase family protein [Chitinophagaceae bacterium]